MEDRAATEIRPTGPAVPGPPQLELERGATVGRYLIVGRLAADGMGVVYAPTTPSWTGRRPQW